MKEEDEQVRENRTESDGMAENARGVRPMPWKGVEKAGMVGKYVSEETSCGAGVPCLLDGRSSRNQRWAVRIPQSHESTQLLILSAGRDKGLSMSPVQMPLS